MPEALPFSTVLYYCLFSTFVFYQQLHATDFRGRSKVAEFALTMFAFVGTIVGFAFLIYYGWKVVWWAPLILFVIGLLFQFVANYAERIFGPHLLSLAGFVAWPLFAYLMFSSLPKGV